MAQRHNDSMISVIMPCYNAERFLREAVDSVLNQTHGNVELIVVDDGSTDGSRAVLSDYGDRIRVLAQPNHGPYRARNLGLSHASGEYVAFLDADDFWNPVFLERLYEALRADPGPALAYCGWQHIGASDRSNEPFVPRDYEVAEKLELLLSGGSPWPIHAALVPRAAAVEIGGFREDLATSLDFEFWLRLSASRKVILVPAVMAFYRFHDGGQISSQPWRQAINGWRIKRRFLEEHPEAAAGIGQRRVRTLVDGGLLKRGYQFYWRRDLGSARRVFRKSLAVGGWNWADLRYLLPSLMPEGLYRFVIGASDQRKEPGS